MTLAVVPFRPEHLPAVRRLTDRAYRRPRGDDYHHWAFLANPAHRAWLAMDGDECVALLRAFARPYQIGGRRITCLEIFDWYSTPESRRAAAGLRVMRAAMREPEPLINVGGTADTLAILPRLGWRWIDDAANLVLPLAGRALSPRLEERAGRLRPAAHAALTVGSWVWFPHSRRRRPAGGEVVPVAVPGPEILGLYEGDLGHVLVPLPDLTHLRWLTSGFPGAGAFLTLYFLVAGRLHGWAMARVVAGPRGVEAAILEAFCPRSDPEMAGWMVAELVARLRGHGPFQIRSQATGPALVAALRRTRFLVSSRAPVMMWSAPPEVVDGRTNLAMNLQDSPLLPYPESWAPAVAGR